MWYVFIVFATIATTVQVLIYVGLVYGFVRWSIGQLWPRQ